MISAYHNNHLLRFLQICAILSFSYAADFYKLLGISRKATHKEIKKAYREKARINHPDKNKAEGAAEKFAEIARAYEVLSDESKREIYDERGEDGLKKHEDMSGGGGGGGGESGTTGLFLVLFPFLVSLPFFILLVTPLVVTISARLVDSQFSSKIAALATDAANKQVTRTVDLNIIVLLYFTLFLSTQF